MPADFTLDESKKLIISRARGHLTLQELMNHLLELRSQFEDGTIDVSWAQIVHLEDIESLETVTSQKIRQLADASDWPEACPRAVIAPDKLIFGFARMYQMWGGSRTKYFKVSRTETEAEDFIRSFRKKADPVSM